MTNKKISLQHVAILLICSYALFVLGNGILGLTNDNEVFYAQTAKEMIQQKSWATPYLFGQPQFEKPIFTYWLLRIGFYLFGVSSFGARFFPALFAIIGVIAVYFLGLIGFKDEKKAFLSGLILMSSAMYIGLGKTVFTDMFFSVLILLALLFFFWGYSDQRKKMLGFISFAVFSGLAVLTKGPLGLIIPVITVGLFLLCKKDIKFLFCKHFILSFFVFFLVAGPWYLLMIAKYGNNFIQEFIYNVNTRRLVEAQHVSNDTWYFYPLTVITSMFPWSLFIAAALFFLPRSTVRKDNPFYLFLTCWAGTIFLLFQLAHSKVANYIFPIFPAVAILVGGFIVDMLADNKHRRLLLFLCGGTLFVILLFPIGFTVSFNIFKAYIVYKLPVYSLIVGFVILSALMLFFMIRKRMQNLVYALVAVMPIFLINLPLLHKNFEAYVSSRAACEYLLKNYQVDNTILCSKFFVRGIKYYTDKDVVIINIGGKPFFSRHALRALDSREKVKDFLYTQGVTYCILSKSSLKTIKDIIPEKNITVLTLAGNEYVVKVELPRS
ncbi:MAG: glycosyltransferase family 39 protein [Candidatus Omnitrophota bacterium]